MIKKETLTILIIAAMAASVIPVMAENSATEVSDPEEIILTDEEIPMTDPEEETGEEDAETESDTETDGDEATEKPTATAKPNSTKKELKKDLAGNTVITGESEVIYSIGAPILNASIQLDGAAYTLTLSTFEGCEIYYTADGSTPLPGSKNTSKYSSPIKLSLEDEDDKEEDAVSPAELRIVVIDPDGSMDGAVASSYFANIDDEALATPEPDSYVAGFWTDGGRFVEPQTVYEGEKLEEPTTTKSGYTFDGWYKDELFENKWNFSSDTVTEDVILYAKWLSADISVTSIYHTIDQTARTIIPDSNSSTTEFIRKLRFPNNSTYKLTKSDGTEASAAEPVQEGMILSVTAQDGKTTVQYTVKSTTTNSGEVIAPVITPTP